MHFFGLCHERIHGNILVGNCIDLWSQKNVRGKHCGLMLTQMFTKFKAFLENLLNKKHIF